LCTGSNKLARLSIVKREFEFEFELELIKMKDKNLLKVNGNLFLYEKGNPIGDTVLH